MLLRSTRGKRGIKKNLKVGLDALCEQVKEIRKRSEYIMITPKPTGNSWRGIHNSSLAFAPHSLFIIPQYYSQTVYTAKELEKLSSVLVRSDFSIIIFSGFPPYFLEFIRTIHKFKVELSKEIKVLLIYHGSLATNREDSSNIELLKIILHLQHQGIIDCIGFIKKGMHETFQKLLGTRSFHLVLKTPLYETGKIPFISNVGKLNVGVFTHDQYRKNIDNQLAAALMISGARVHTHTNYQFEYFQQNDRIFFHPFMESYSDFLTLVKSMTINFYITFSECFGLFITESLALGVPCLAADNSGVFDYDEWLHEKLIVKEFDNSNAIYEQAKIVLNHRDEISERAIQYISKLNEIAEEKYNSFLDG